MRRRNTLEDALNDWGIYKRREILRDLIANVPAQYRQVVKAAEESRILVEALYTNAAWMKVAELYYNTADSYLWDVALPRAAASHEITWPKTLNCEGRKYQIDIRQSIPDANKGVIIVTVHPDYRTTLEGKMIEVFDGQGRLLLRAKVFDGAAAQEINDLDTINLDLLIKPVE